MELTTRFLEVLNYPILHRCPEIGLIIDRCSTKQLQDIFPILIQSIFGTNGLPGWGFRTITNNDLSGNPSEFNVLYNFFIPLGPMFRLCYRLLNDSLKFELPIAYIPQTMRQMLESGRYPLFYSDTINIDPFQRKVVSLSLNAFDYYMVNFVIHGTVPLHKHYPIALTIHNEKWKTVYYYLAADYLCTFLPSNPDSVVMPQNICGSVKSSTMMPVQPVQSPVRSPKYLSLSAISHYSPTNNISSTPELPRVHAWRSETVLYIFIDFWFKFDRDEAGDLPGNEFMSVARILVKQIHAFSNSADMDNTSMSTLRKIAQPMMNARMFPFLKTIISRWPLDTSFSCVLELWLSFIQPWRYTYDRNLTPNQEIPITQKYETFISENLICYTQIFVQLIPRFLNIDLTTVKNSVMLYRVVKVLNQSRLSDILRNYEHALGSSFGNTTNFHGTSPKHERMKGINSTSMMSSFNKTTGNDISNGFFQDDSYLMMFGEETIEQLSNLVHKIQMSKITAFNQLIILEKEHSEHYKGIIQWIKSFFINDNAQSLGNTLIDIRKIPDILEVEMRTLSRMFNIPIIEPSIMNTEMQSINENLNDEFNFDISNELDKTNSCQLSPMSMKKRALNIQYSGDPALIPIRYNECTFLVRFLHQLSCKLNLMFSSKIEEFWNRNDIWGSLARHILSPPMIAQTFDKSYGYSKLKEEHLGPRISLRYLAGYKTFGVIIMSFIFGQIIFGVPSFGLLLLILLAFLYLFILSLVHDVPI